MKKPALIGGTLLCAVCAHAGIIYSNLGPGNTFGGSDTTISDVTNFGFGTVFRAAATGVLNDILVPIADDPNGVVNISLSTDASLQPGTLLEAWNNVTVPAVGSALITLNSAAHPTLTANSLYWLTVVSGPETAGHFGLQWGVSPILSSGGIWVWSTGQPWTHIGTDFAPAGIQVESTTPEPGTYLLIGCSLIALALRRRRA